MYTTFFDPAPIQNKQTFSETPNPPDTTEQFASDEDVLSVSLRLITKNREAYEVLAK